ncbi:MAG: formate dehydrogenase accessory protein FdhE [Nitrospirota bacterium]
MASATLIKRLMRERPHLREPLRFYRHVSEIWEAAIPDDLGAVLAPPEERPLRLARGLPLLDPSRFGSADLTHTADTFTQLLAVLRSRNPGLARALDALDHEAGRGPERARWLARLLGGLGGPPESAPVEFVGYAVRLALRPSLAALLPALSDVFTDRAWNRPLCPLCGFPPGLAEERERDRRLFCSVCPTAWIFTRPGCPFCGNAADQHLACSIEDVEPGYHVAICTECRGYLKTAHAHEIGRDIDPALEDLLTVPLDHAAQRDGYRPPLAADARDVDLAR